MMMMMSMWAVTFAGDLEFKGFKLFFFGGRGTTVSYDHLCTLLQRPFSFFK